MKPLLPILIWLWPCLAMAQAKEVSSLQRSDSAKTILRQTQAGKPEIFTSGFIDIMNNGQINAVTLFYKIVI